MIIRAVPLALIAAAGLLAGCGDGSRQPGQSSSAETSPPAGATAAPALTQAAVWDGAGLDACRQQADIDACFIRTAEAAGMKQAAAVRFLVDHDETGYVSGWRDEGGVGVATATYPMRANTNEGTWLVPASGDPINTEQAPDGLDADPAFKAFRAAHPDADPFPPAAFVRNDSLPSGQRLVFETPLRTCHACAQDGKLTVGYDFDAAGAFTGTKVLSGG